MPHILKNKLFTLNFMGEQLGFILVDQDDTNNYICILRIVVTHQMVYIFVNRNIHHDMLNHNHEVTHITHFIMANPTIPIYALSNFDNW